MTGKSQSEDNQSVLVVETDIFDRMNETRELIAQRAYEIYPEEQCQSGDAAVARKIVAYLVAVDRRQKGFLVVENENRSAA